MWGGDEMSFKEWVGVSHMKRVNKDKEIPGKGIVWARIYKHEAIRILWCLKSKQGVVIDEIIEKLLGYEKFCVLC